MNESVKLLSYHTLLKLLNVLVKTYAVEVLAAVLKVEGDAFASKDTTCDNRTPIEYLCWVHAIEIQKALALSKEESAILLNSKVDSDFKTLWRKVLLLLKSECSSLAEKSGKKAKKWPIVHASVSVKNCPADVVRLAVKFHPEQLEKFDEDQKLPLHLALENGTSNEAIQVLLQAHPSAASISDISGRYPFLMAALEGNDAAILFHLLQLCPEIERFFCNGSKLESMAHRSDEATQKHASLKHDDFGNDNILQYIDCTAFDTALFRKKMRCH